jgi:hypothetical protein
MEPTLESIFPSTKKSKNAKNLYFFFCFRLIYIPTHDQVITFFSIFAQQKYAILEFARFFIILYNFLNFLGFLF